MKASAVTEFRIAFEEFLNAMGVSGELAEVAYFDRFAQEVVFHVRAKEAE